MRYWLSWNLFFLLFSVVILSCATTDYATVDPKMDPPPVSVYGEKPDKAWSFYNYLTLDQAKSLSRESANRDQGTGGKIQTRRSILAVLPFRNSSGDSLSEWLSPALMTVLVNDLSFEDSIVLIERNSVESAFKNFGAGKLIDDQFDAERRIGKALSADFVLVGDYTTNGNEIEFNVRVLNMKNGRIDFTLTKRSKNDTSLFTAQDDIARELVLQIHGGAILRPTAEAAAGTLPIEVIRDYEVAYKMRAEGRIDEAEGLIRKILVVKPDYIDAAIFLVDILRNKNKFDESVDLINASLGKITGSSKVERSEKARLYLKLSNVYLSASRAAELDRKATEMNKAAEEVDLNLKNAAAVIGPDVFTSSSILVMDFYGILGGFEDLKEDFLKKRPTGAFRYYAYQNLKHAVRLYGYESVYSAGALLSIGRSYMIQDNTLRASQFFLEAIKICEALGDVYSTTYAYSLQFVGGCNWRERNIPVAREYFNRALEIQERLFGPESTAVKRLKANLLSLR